MENEAQISLLLSPVELMLLLSLCGAELLDGLELPAPTGEQVESALLSLEESGIIAKEDGALIVSSVYHAICRAMSGYRFLLLANVGYGSFSLYFHDKLCVAAEYSRPDLIRLTPLQSQQEALPLLRDAASTEVDEVALLLIEGGIELARRQLPLNRLSDLSMAALISIMREGRE